MQDDKKIVIYTSDPHFDHFILALSFSAYIVSMSPITCHVLDTALGKPAVGVVCSIYKVAPLVEDKSVEAAYDIGQPSAPFAMSRTDNDGRVKEWTANPQTRNDSNLGFSDGNWSTLVPGIYKIKFLTGKYFHDLNSQNRTFFPFVEIVFQIDNPPDNHYHVPLLLSNHSYSTYRGS